MHSRPTLKTAPRLALRTDCMPSYNRCGNSRNIPKERYVKTDFSNEIYTPSAKVVWDKDECWDKHKKAGKSFCGPGAVKVVGDEGNLEKWVGASCNCGSQSANMYGIDCLSRCDKRKFNNETRACQKQSMMCYHNAKTRKPECGCPNGRKLMKHAGGRATCQKVDFCGTCLHKCHKASRCMPRGDFYNCEPCSAEKGYEGTGFQCNDIDECMEGTHDCDTPNAICENVDPIYSGTDMKYKCICEPGWTADPQGGYKARPCVDVNECTTGAHKCNKFATCENNLGGYSCICQDGFRKSAGSIHDCEDINECKELAPCHKKARCHNLPGNYSCTCHKGFIGDGITSCEPDREFWCNKCDKETTDCVLGDKGDMYICKCKSGFQPQRGTKHRCEDINECSIPSLNNCDKTPGYATCKNLPGSFSCKCNEGYEGDGVTCKPTDPCLIGNPCAFVAGSVCRNNNGEAVCECKPNFVRQVKDQKNMTAPCFDIRSAPVNNCTICNNATSECRMVGQGPHHECVCKAGYQMNAAGRCVNINECRHPSENNCDANARCVDREPAIHNVRFMCICHRGYSGKGTLGECQDVNECLNATYACPLPNQLCVNSIGSYSCDCEKGFRKPNGLSNCVNINECEEGLAGCPLNTKCIDKTPGYECICLGGFKSVTLANATKFCDNIDECTEGVTSDGIDGTTDACDMVNGICKDIYGSYACDCKPGFNIHWDKKTCLDKNECKLGEDTCNKNIEDCFNTVGSFACNCKHGMEKNAEGVCVDIDECATKTHRCLKDSTCVNTFGSYKCECDKGFVRQPNSHPLRPVCKRENICQKHETICIPGTCHSTETAPFYRCICASSAIALNDTKCVYPNYCDNDFPCPDKSKCMAKQCICPPGYLWPETKEYPLTINSLKNRHGCIEINPCVEFPNLCGRPLICVHTGPGTHKCDCEQGFELSGGECIDIDECNLAVGGAQCPENSKCENLIGSYKCECDKGFVAKVGSTRRAPECIDVNECEAGLDNCREQNSTCTNTLGSFTCACGTGYSMQAPDYKVCKDDDECHLKTAKCDANAFCINIPGSYECECKKGYNGDGESCWDIDECDLGEPTHNCTSNQECVNMEGTFNCTCKKGYELTAKGCVDINECLNEANNDCGAKGGDIRQRCVNNEGGYICVCPEGFFSEGDHCKDINECELTPSPCPKGIENLCKNLNGTFRCDCATGYRKPKRTTDHLLPCEDIDECKEGIKVNGKGRKACGSGAKCLNSLGDYKCECNPGFEGDAYSTAGCKVADICIVKNPCNNITQNCVSSNGKAECLCKKGYILNPGKVCQPNPCSLNNGDCGKGATCHVVPKAENATAECRCEYGMKLDEKKNCEKIDHCKCDIKGQCTLNKKGCKAGEVPFGVACKSKKVCSATHMMCLGKKDSFECVCETGWKLSEDKKECINVNECVEGVEGNVKNIACGEGARCIDLPGTYTCDCPRGKIQDSTRKCIPDTPDCSREGNCKHDHNSFCKLNEVNKESLYYCQCKAGFEGNGTVENPCIKIDWCARKNADGSDLCGVNEKCVNEVLRHKCECLPGYCRENPASSCENVNECESGMAHCPVTYVCEDTQGGYLCKCPIGYYVNETDQRCDDFNECLNGMHKCDPVKEKCINTPGAYRCDCNSPAWIKTTVGCVDNNECETNMHDCPEFSVCENTIGGYKCLCQKGFREFLDKDGKVQKCDDIDECKEGKPCPGIADCKNKLGSYECICKAPQIQNGQWDCVVNATCPEKCHANAHCLKSDKVDGLVYNCTCAPGYRGDGVKNCDPIDECKEKTAVCHAMADCIDLTPLYSCKCREPYEGDGHNVCKKKDVCKVMNDCPQGAVCTPLDEQVEGKWVTCECPEGFSFNKKTRECDDIDECDTIKPCAKQPEGVECKNTQGSFACICPKGYVSQNHTHCKDVDECLDVGQLVCSKTFGKCENTEGSFICICPEGFRQSEDKKSCIDIDECVEKTDNCDKKSSTCLNTVGSFDCKCIKGFNYIPGKKNVCEDVDECLLGTHNCKPITQLCHNTEGSFACNCSNGYKEESNGNCAPMSNCDLECGVNAFCVKRAKREDPSKLLPECVCQDGYIGDNPAKFCDPVPDCEKDNQCPSNAKCVESQAKDSKGRATYICACDLGYRKIGSQCENINECVESPGICGTKALCVDLQPLYKCACQPGALDVGTGVNNVTCVNPTCTNQETKPCHAEATCLDTADGFTCKCNNGFRGHGIGPRGCDLIDQCKEYTPCSQYATCTMSTEVRGTVNCVCNRGYKGNGTMCYDIDECANTNEPACDKNADCKNTQGSYKCQCKTGYAGSGLPGKCLNIDECKDPRENKCETMTICKDTEGSFECHCKPGYYRPQDSTNLYGCSDIDECVNTTHPVCNPHKCINKPGDYMCECNPGYKLRADGRGCDDIDECENSPCHPHALCTNQVGSYSCACKAGYSGDGVKECTIVDKCSKPELHLCNLETTKCHMILGTAQYRCECLPGYTPPANTTTKYYHCLNVDECKNGQANYDPETEICQDKPGSFDIHCATGYARKKETGKCHDLDECSEDPAYKESLENLKKARKEKKNTFDWKSWMVAPKNASSAYAICYNAAVTNNRWIFVGASQPLPWCKNNKYSTIGAFAGKIPEWKGFNCSCPPSMHETAKVFGGSKFMYTCSAPDPCAGLNCGEVGEGYVCINNNEGNGQCVCDSSAGYREREEGGKAYCTKRECEAQDVQGPSSISVNTEKTLVTCNLNTNMWQAKPGYRLERCNVTNKVLRVHDIDECAEIPNFCCDQVKAQCSARANTTDRCRLSCHNTIGSAACLCQGAENVDFEPDTATCSCKAKCSKVSAWYLRCVGDKIFCDMEKLENLVNAKGAPQGKVCSRLRGIDSGKAIEFESALHLVKEICNKINSNGEKYHCTFPANEISDIRDLPVYNYDGPCDNSKGIQTPKPTCPNGTPPLSSKDLAYAYCPYANVDRPAWDKRLNPGSPKGSNIPLRCMDGAGSLESGTLWYPSSEGVGLDMFQDGE